MTKKMNPVVFYLVMLLYVVMAVVLRVAVFAPLYALFAFEKGSALRYLAVLCPVFFVFILLPLRFSFADALVQEPRERYFSLKKAFSFAQYGEKLSQSLLHALCVLLWGIPFFAAVGYGYDQYAKGNLLTFQTIDTVSKIGNQWNNIYYAVLNFFQRLFGKTVSVIPANGFMDGVFVLLALLGITLLIWLYGAIRNSATRYIWVIAERNNRPLRAECRHQLIGRRWRQLGVALLNFVLCMPFFAAVYFFCRDHINEIMSDLLNINTIMNMIRTHSLPDVNVGGSLKMIPILFFLCYLTLLPARRYLTASFATASRRHKV